MVRYIDSNGLATTSSTLGVVPVIEMLQLLVALMWTCLKLTARKNPIFDKVFPITSLIYIVCRHIESGCGRVAEPS
jgi:hypothetical protein